MGFTRYWENSKNLIDDKTLETIKNIIDIAKQDYDIDIDVKALTNMYIKLNGDESKDLDHEDFIIDLTPGFNFCKTNEKPYDIVVNAILKLLESTNKIHDVEKDDDSEEEEAEKLLNKALSMKEILKIKITKINDLWYSWYIDYIDNKIFKLNPSKDFQIEDKNFRYYAKESYDNNIAEWTSAYGYKNYTIYLSINNIDKQPCLIKKELVKDFEKAIEWINNNVK
jgi:hypothetical protein